MAFEVVRTGDEDDDDDDCEEEEGEEVEEEEEEDFLGFPTMFKEFPWVSQD